MTRQDFIGMAYEEFADQMVKDKIFSKTARNKFCKNCYNLKSIHHPVITDSHTPITSAFIWSIKECRYWLALHIKFIKAYP